MLGRKTVILKLCTLTMLGKNSKTADLLRKSSIFAEYGGNIGIQHGFHHILN